MPIGVYPRVSLESRFWSKVNFDGPLPEYASHLGPCWLWKAGKSSWGKWGKYGGFYVAGKGRRAHRVAYFLLYGKCAPLFDHLCRVMLCVRPDHLEPVSPRENLLRSPDALAAINARKTACPRGHPYDAVRKSGGRRCRACDNRGNREHAAKKTERSQQHPR